MCLILPLSSDFWNIEHEPTLDRYISLKRKHVLWITRKRKKKKKILGFEDSCVNLQSEFCSIFAVADNVIVNAINLSK